MKKPVIVATIATLIAATLIAGFLLYRGYNGVRFDTRLQSALEAVQSPQSYEARVETATELSDRKIDVLGLYRLDFSRNRFGSFGTTTLTIPGEPKKNRFHTFSLNNVSIGPDIYLQINTRSPLLQKTIPYGDVWHHLRSGAIPEQFRDIAVDGPVLDNLALLGKRGAYLELLGTPEERSADDVHYRVYAFKLSKRSAHIEGGTLKSLVGRIGTGTVRLWIDTETSLRMMTIESENYRSTTTVLHVNTPLEILPPETAE